MAGEGRGFRAAGTFADRIDLIERGCKLIAEDPAHGR